MKPIRKGCLDFSVFSELLNRGFILDLILKLVGAKIICQQLYDQTESKLGLQLPLQLKAEELYQKNTGEFVSFVAGRKILEQEEMSVMNVVVKSAFLRFLGIRIGDTEV